MRGTKLSEVREALARLVREHSAVVHETPTPSGETAWGVLPEGLHRLTASLEAKARALDLDVLPPGVSRHELSAVVDDELDAVLTMDPRLTGLGIGFWFGLPLAARAGWSHELLIVGREEVRTLPGTLVRTSGRWVTVRTTSRALLRLDRTRLLVLSSSSPPERTAATVTRRAAFDAFLAENPALKPVSRPPIFGHSNRRHAFTCPACGYPTRVPQVLGKTPELTTSIRDPSVCFMCGWADAEGFDDGSTLHLASRANDGLSLFIARANVCAAGVVFDADRPSSLSEAFAGANAAESRRKAASLFNAVLDVEAESILQYDAWCAAHAVIKRGAGEVDVAGSERGEPVSGPDGSIYGMLGTSLRDLLH